MQRLKLILTVIIGAAALLVVLIALFWRSLLTPEQKLHYGLVFSATDGFAARAQAHSTNAQALSDYADALARSGNLGRALYLADLYGAQSELLDSLRAPIAASLKAAAQGEVYDFRQDEAVAAVQELPVRQALRLLQGYRHAVLGDWSSAKNYFSAIEERQLAPPLRPYYRYYLGRCYRLAGDAKQKAQVEQLLLSVLKDQPGAELEARARYNLIALYLSADYKGRGLAAAKDQSLSLGLAESSWAKQKALTEYGQYYLRLGQLPDAWRAAQDALSAGPALQPGDAAGQLCLDILELAVQPGSTELDAQGKLLLELAPGTPVALAQAGARHGFSVRAAKLLSALKPHLTDRKRWEELYVALALCYGAEANLAGMQQLMAQGNLRGLSNASLGRIYFEYAQLLAARKQWNQALGYYKNSAKLGGPGAAQGGAGEAYYRCYAILKQVQEPLDQAVAVSLLQQIVEQHEDSPTYGKAVEELIPLLLNQGSPEAARRLCRHILQQPAEEAAPDAADRRELTRILAQYWLDYLDNKAGRPRGKREAGCRYWSYYELAQGDPPPLKPPTAPDAVLKRPETAAEYFAGLGLDAFADGTADALPAGDPVASYAALAHDIALKPVATRQWEATQLLESGAVSDPALLRFVLGQAYPRPYEKETAAASKRFGVPQALIYAVIKKESSFKEDAVSAVGAQGLMQLMPPTAQWLTGLYALPADYYSRRTQPAVNIMLGTAYLASLYGDLGLKPGQGDGAAVRKVLHCYNGGPANYEHWRSLYPNASGTLLTELIPNEENELFAKKVWKYYRIYAWLEAQ